MRRPITIGLLSVVWLLPLPALCKPWNGITPGKSERAEVVAKFGEPSKVVTANGKEVLAYLKNKQIRGTTQAQFKLDPKTGVVDRIDVFPAPVLTIKDIEAGYGSECTKAQPETDEQPCYARRDEGNKKYIVYQRLGLAIFFKDDGTTVQSFTFLPEKKK